MSEMQNWELKKGVDFFQKIELGKNSRVLDFGARIGHYSIPAALKVGNKGQVISVDKDKKTLDELNCKAEKLNLKNIETIHSDNLINEKTSGEKFDMILLYDIMHFFQKDSRLSFYRKLKNCLKAKGILSFYPKHTKNDIPADEFIRMSKKEVLNELKNCGYSLNHKFCTDLSHDDEIIFGCVYNFHITD